MSKPIIYFQFLCPSADSSGGFLLVPSASSFSRMIGTTAVAKSLCLHGNSVGVSRFSTWHRRSLLRRRFCDRLVFIMALSPEIESVLAGMFVWVRSGVVG